MRGLLLIGMTPFFAGPTAAQDEGIMGPFPGSQRLEGPSLICSYAFGLQLAPGEYIDRREGVDFSLYYTQAVDGAFLLYEGNAPQPHDDEIQTGLRFPSVIAIHDNRSAEAKARSRIRDRLLTGEAFADACPQPDAN